MKNMLLSGLFLVLCSGVRPAGAAEDLNEFGLRQGGSWGVGVLNRYGPSYHTGASFAFTRTEGAGVPIFFGLDFSADTQHIVKPDSSRGLGGPQKYDAKINMWHIGPWMRADVPLGPALSISPMLGIGDYQINTFERCNSLTGAPCQDSKGNPYDIHYVNTSDYVGVNVGLQLLIKPGAGFVIGLEARLHQLLGGGRHTDPTFFTPSVFLAKRFLGKSSGK